ncbi:unnamed protein product [Soboliphyme baturini]|uniref:MBD domain-containing protein n=1 Tax=Soboliphyme baturini TaxID=241478 RepID=A0A183I9U2_9BILA|nr:unnamed protein product [Soboliphyme baturini]
MQKNLDFMLKACSFSITQLQIIFTIFGLNLNMDALRDQYELALQQKPEDLWINEDFCKAPGFLRYFDLRQKLTHGETSSNVTNCVEDDDAKDGIQVVPEMVSACNDAVDVEKAASMFELPSSNVEPSASELTSDATCAATNGQRRRKREVRSRIRVGRHKRPSSADEGPQEQLAHFDVSIVDLRPIEYHAHVCGTACLPYSDDPDNCRDAFPFMIPLLCGWNRVLLRIYGKPSYVDVVYVAPCGRRIRGFADLIQYLRITNSRLTLELFCFDSKLRVAATITVEQPRVLIPDIANGEEIVPIQCVNALDDDRPDEHFTYRSARYSNDPRIDLDEAKMFLSGCSCTGNE